MKQDVNSGSFYNYLWAYILVALSGCLGNVVDGIIVGNLVSADGVSAINYSKPVVQFIFTLHLLVNAGAGMLVGYALGKQNLGDARKLFSRSLALSVGLGLLFSLFGGLLFPAQVTNMLCHEELIRPLARQYLQVLLFGAPAYILMWGLSTMVGVDGSPRLVSLAVIVDNVVNLCLDIVFIQFFGWGIAGSSSATIVGHVVGIAIMFWHFRYKDNHLQLLFRNVELKLKKAFSQIISQGAPLAIASVCLTLLLYSANSIVLGTLGRTGIFAFAVCMNLLQIYNLFLAGVCRTIQSLGAIQVGKGDNEAFRLVLRKSFSFITVAMILICIVVWVDPNVISRLFGANDPTILAESNHALRIFSLSFIPFCYIYVIMIVYKLYAHHRMALFISFALSLTVIPVLWLVSKFAPSLLWYSYLIAYLIEIAAILVLHHVMHARFELKVNSE